MRSGRSGDRARRAREPDVNRRPPKTRRNRGAQLTLVDGEAQPWYLSPRTRSIGNAGVARARDALARADRPEPREARRAG